MSAWLFFFYMSLLHSLSLGMCCHTWVNLTTPLLVSCSLCCDSHPVSLTAFPVHFKLLSCFLGSCYLSYYLFAYSLPNNSLFFIALATISILPMTSDIANYSIDALIVYILHWAYHLLPFLFSGPWFPNHMTPVHMQGEISSSFLRFGK